MLRFQYGHNLIYILNEEAVGNASEYSPTFAIENFNLNKTIVSENFALILQSQSLSLSHTVPELISLLFAETFVCSLHFAFAK